jgi:hypothetical protein
MAFPVQTVVEVMLAISLSAAAGFRVFIPLLALSTASVLGHVDLPARFDWIENPQAMTLFAIAALLEIIGYSIPWFDHLLDIVATPAAIISGTIVAASLASEMGLGPGLWWRCGGDYQGFDESTAGRIDSGHGRTSKPRICLWGIGDSCDSVGAGYSGSCGRRSIGPGHLWVWDL